MGTMVFRGPNCIHYNDGSCLKKPKFFFGLFRDICNEYVGYKGYQPCTLREPFPRPAPPSPQRLKPNVCDICGTIMSKDW